MKTITVTLTAMQYGGYEVCYEDDTAFYQSDWDFPSLASALGWRLANVQTGIDIRRDWTRHDHNPCSHPFTDGTVPCDECGIIATSFIEAAMHWLDDNEGQIQIPESAYDSIAWCKEEE